MKSLLFPVCLLILLSACELDPLYDDTRYECIEPAGDGSVSHPKEAVYQGLIDEMAATGAPGIMMTIRDEGGIWSGAAGKADLAGEVNLKPCHITRVGSTVKTFTAATLLLLQEEGKLDLDDRIADYLSPDDLRGLANTGVVTIRQLLQHSSGIFNYIVDPVFQTASLNDLIKVWKPDELLSYARNKPADFPPGTDARYSNTGYILLGRIIEAVEGRPFYEAFQERLFWPHGLAATRFAAENPVPEGIIQGYVDFYSNLNVINATYYSGWDYYTADGGLIANSFDLNRFLTRLFQGEILSETSLGEMTDWMMPDEQDSEGFETRFGLGLFRIETDHGPAYMHSGDAIGYYAGMAYFPEQQVTITWAANGNYGRIDDITQSKEAMEKIFDTVLGSP